MLPIVRPTWCSATKTSPLYPWHMWTVVSAGSVLAVPIATSVGSGWRCYWSPRTGREQAGLASRSVALALR